MTEKKSAVRELREVFTFGYLRRSLTFENFVLFLIFLVMVYVIAFMYYHAFTDPGAPGWAGFLTRLFGGSVQ